MKSNPITVHIDITIGILLWVSILKEEYHADFPST